MDGQSPQLICVALHERDRWEFSETLTNTPGPPKVHTAGVTLSSSQSAPPLPHQVGGGWLSVGQRRVSTCQRGQYLLEGSDTAQHVGVAGREDRSRAHRT